MGITFGDHLIDSGYRDPTEETEETERKCQKCGAPTRGEEALTSGGQYWCHPCADADERPYGEVLDEMDHERKYQTDLNELTTQRALLREALTTLHHARIFISTREKMHPVGISLYDDLVRKIEEAIGAKD